MPRDQLHIGVAIMALNQESCILDPEVSLQAICYSDFKTLISSLGYATPVRVMLLMLAYTGCRVAELERMRYTDLVGNTIYWRPGKNQKGHRKETLPQSYINELNVYRADYPVAQGLVFGMRADVFRRHFNCLRKDVGGRWVLKTSEELNGPSRNKNYVLQLKGLRKTFQTILFRYYSQKYGDSMVALGMVAKRMRHAAKETTLHHYIEAHDKIEADRWEECFFSRKPSYEAQRKMWEYGGE